MIRSARQAGATCAQIGEALEITKQAAYDFYRRKIEEQEKYLSDLHDVAGALGRSEGRLARGSVLSRV